MRNLKFLFVLYFCLLSAASFTQNFTLMSKIEKDSISIKWLPSDFDAFTKLIKGATVERIESTQNANFSSLDFSVGKSWKIESTKNRYAKLDATKPRQDKSKVLLEPFMEKDFPNDQKNFPFGTAIIENVINPDFQFIVGNIIVDKSFSKNKTYVYKVTIKEEAPLYIFIDHSKKTKYSSIESFKLSLDKKKVVSIEWDSKKYQKESLGYDIEHSIDNKNNKEDLLELPYLPFRSEHEIDSKFSLVRDNAEPGHTHYYRIIGRDAFGHKALHSEWKKIYVPLLINAWAQIDTVFAKMDDRIINASIHSYTSTNSSIKEIVLLRSSLRDSNYSVMQKTSYTDSTIKFTIKSELRTGDGYYYKIRAINDDDTISSIPYYFFTLDQEPPQPPTEISGTIDSNGVVSLKWLASIDSDIRGYKVFRANTKKEEFVEKTTNLFTTLSFKDTLSLNNLTSEVFYFLQAVDLNFNQSITSDTILIIKPDTIAPIPCILSNVIIEKDRLNVTWVNSDSKDLKANQLIRYFKNSVDTLNSWSKEENNFIDSNLIKGENYRYQIVTFDRSNNKSYSNEIQKYYEPGYREKIQNFQGKINIEKKVIHLTWDKPKDEIFSYQIFRAKSEGKILPLKTIHSVDETYYEDRNIHLNNQYIYTINYVNESGIHSIPARIEVVYQ